jgi:hypothetical protein
MALCEHCRAGLPGSAERLPPPWSDHDRRTIAGRRTGREPWRVLEVLWRRRGRIVSTESLMALAYGDRADDPPGDKIMLIWILRLRRGARADPPM